MHASKGLEFRKIYIMGMEGSSRKSSFLSLKAAHGGFASWSSPDPGDLVPGKSVPWGQIIIRNENTVLLWLVPEKLVPGD